MTPGKAGQMALNQENLMRRQGAFRSRRLRQKATEAFIAYKADIDAMLDRLANESADHFGCDPEQINWGHAGDLDDIASRLREISDKVFREGEYA